VVAGRLLPLVLADSRRTRLPETRFLGVSRCVCGDQNGAYGRGSRLRPATGPPPIRAPTPTRQSQRPSGLAWRRTARARDSSRRNTVRRYGDRASVPRRQAVGAKSTQARTSRLLTFTSFRTEHRVQLLQRYQGPCKVEIRPHLYDDPRHQGLESHAARAPAPPRGVRSPLTRRLHHPPARRRYLSAAGGGAPAVAACLERQPSIGTGEVAGELVGRRPARRHSGRPQGRPRGRGRDRSHTHMTSGLGSASSRAWKALPRTRAGPA